MANNDLKKKPHHISDSAWWYEEPRGISVIVECLGIETKTINIPWRSIRAALRRKAKKVTK